MPITGSIFVGWCGLLRPSFQGSGQISGPAGVTLKLATGSLRDASIFEQYHGVSFQPMFFIHGPANAIHDP
jgi:hypothetical protein